MKQFTKEQMQKARITNLYDFLLKNHPDAFTREGDSLRMKSNNSISIKRGFCGYTDFSNGDKGNSVDFLTKHMGYSLDAAVFALIDGNYIPSIHESNSQEKQTTAKTLSDDSLPQFPEPISGPYRNLFAYLLGRGISQETIQMLADKNLIYQEAEHNNIVFANGCRDWGEIHGTFTQGDKSFHGMVKNSRSDGFWSFRTCEDKTKLRVAYICEAAIDAISLYEIHVAKQQTYNYEEAVYISIGGASKQATIDRVKEFIKIVIAVDNDAAGSECRKRNVETESAIPRLKDWNEDLIALLNDSVQFNQSSTEENQNNKMVESNPELEQIIKEGVNQGLITPDWMDPYHDADHARYMLNMMRNARKKEKIDSS